MALPTKLTLEIVTPDRSLVTEQVDEVELPGSEGYFGVLPGHSPLLASLQVGELWYRIGNEHYNVARSVKQILQRYKDLKDIIAILGIDELSEDDRLTVSRARKLQRFLSQPFFVAAKFTGRDGKYVSIGDTIKGFKEIVDGKHDGVPEQAFYLQGTIEDVLENAKKLKQ